MRQEAAPKFQLLLIHKFPSAFPWLAPVSDCRKTGCLQSLASLRLAPSSIILVSSCPFSPKLLEMYFKYLLNHVDLGCPTFVNITAQHDFMYKRSTYLKKGLALSIFPMWSRLGSTWMSLC